VKSPFPECRYDLNKILSIPDDNLNDNIGIDSRPSSKKDKQKDRPIIVQGLDSGTVIGIAFAAFIIGVLLTASLWYIHTHTGPTSQKNKHKMVRRRGESSGESTPSSSVPMAV
jgi:transforming growth factor beta receptor III